MPPLNRSSCDPQEDGGKLCHKVLSLDEEDEQSDHRSTLPTPGIISDLGVVTKLPRRVNFALDQENYLLMRDTGDYSNDEIQDCWYRETDFLSFRQEALVTLEIYKKSPERVDNREYTMRGLEYHLAELRSRRKLLRRLATRIVLDDQEFSDDDDASESKSDHIAKLYSMASRDSVGFALCRAARDRSDAKEYQREKSSELFNDDWIRCISSTGKNVSCPQSHQQTWSMGFSAKDDISGFDDSWLCVPSNNTGLIRGIKSGA